MSVTLVINGDGNFAQEMRKNRDAQDNLYREGVKWLNAIKTPQEKHNDNIRKLRELTEKNILSEKEYARAKEHSLQRMNKALDAALPKQKSMVESVAQQAAGWLSVAGAIGVAKAALDDYNQRAEQSKQRQTTSAQAFGELAQISSSPAEYSKLVREAKRLQSFTGNEAEAANMVSAFQNAGYTDKGDLLARLRRGHVIGDVDKALTSASQVQTAAPGLSITSVLAAGLAGSAVSNKMFDPIMEHASDAVSMGMQQGGMSFAESMAAYAAVANTTTPEVARTRLQSMYMQAADQGLVKPGNTFTQLMDAGKGATFSESARVLQTVYQGGELTKKYRESLGQIQGALADPVKFLEQKATMQEQTGDAAAMFAASERQFREASAAANIAQDPMGARALAKESRYLQFDAMRSGGDGGPLGTPGRLSSGIQKRFAQAVDYFLDLSPETIGYMLDEKGGGQSVVKAIEKQTRAMQQDKPKAPPLPSVSP